MVEDAAWGSLAGALWSGVVLIGFALELGATPWIIGVLAAIPFLAQLGQLPAVVLVERLRARRRIALVVVTAARILILCLAALPWAVPADMRLGALVAAQVLITVLGAFAGCSINSWFHQMLAGRDLGALYAERLFWSMVVGSLGALAAGALIEHWPTQDRLAPYSICFALAGLAGFVGIGALARIPEPRMEQTGPRQPLLRLLFTPLRDLNFRRLIVFIASWNFAANLSAPFLTVYLLKQLAIPMSSVTSMWAVAQLANAVTLYYWGRISDRLSNKAILAAALPAYLGCLIALPLTAVPDRHPLTVPLLWMLHLVMGAASGGIGLATGNIGLKLAPQSQGTAYLASVTIAGALAAGTAALIGGGLAQWLEGRQALVLVQWSSLTSSTRVLALRLAHWEFLFAASFVFGIYVLHSLSRVRESDERSERPAVRDYALEAGRAFEQATSVAAASLASLFPFGRLFDRRRRGRREEHP